MIQLRLIKKNLMKECKLFALTIRNLNLLQEERTKKFLFLNDFFKYILHKLKKILKLRALTISTLKQIKK